MIIKDTDLVTYLGSCRMAFMSRIVSCTFINDKSTFTHSTKEVIQLLKWLRGELTIPADINNFVFRTAMLRKENIELTQDLIDTFKKTDVFAVELCSNKIYEYQSYYLHHLAADKRYGFSYVKKDDKWTHMMDNLKIRYQSEQEISDDIDEITKLIGNRRLIIVPHVMPPTVKGDLTRRKVLIQYLTNICKQKGITLFDPSKMFNGNIQKELIGDDYGHYTEKGYATVADIFSKQFLIGK